MTVAQKSALITQWFNAIGHKNHTTIKRLATEVDINAVSPKQNMSAVEILARRGEAPTLGLILRLGADPEAGYDGQGDFPLGLAALFGHPECVAELIKAGAKIDQVDRHQRSALALTSVAECAEALIAAGANMELRDVNGLSALMRAALNKKTDCFRVLAQAGANINAVDSYGRSALIYAARNNQAECVRELLSFQADFKMLDNDGLSALDMARSFNSPLIAALLEACELGASVQSAPSLPPLKTGRAL